MVVVIVVFPDGIPQTPALQHPVRRRIIVVAWGHSIRQECCAEITNEALSGDLTCSRLQDGLEDFCGDEVRLAPLCRASVASISSCQVFSMSVLEKQSKQCNFRSGNGFWPLGTNASRFFRTQSSFNGLESDVPYRQSSCLHPALRRPRRPQTGRGPHPRRSPLGTPDACGKHQV